MLDMYIVDNHDVKCNKFNINQIRSDTLVLDNADNWSKLLFKEVY